MNKKVIKVPQGIQYISEWTGYDFPKNHCIVDKGVTGCGYTEYCLMNNQNVVLCSPRKLLLENKSEQHQGDNNILYLKNEIKNYEDILKFKNKIKSFLHICFEDLNEPAKLLITYDSTHYIVDTLKELGLLSDFYFIVDEFQSIFLDSYYKSEVEFDFVEYLQDCPNVLYLSATPMLEKYLNRIPEFMNLNYYEIDWSGTGVVENIVIQRKFARSLPGECIKVVQDYLEGKFPYTYIGNTVLQSTEAVFYFNSITDIIRVINKTGLTSNQVNIICADTKENYDKLHRIGHDIGKIPLRGETNKMFTFCTKTAYIGADFYSDCASSYVFADPNIDSLALDISLDLPQIAGRQRNKNNPFKNNIVIFYKTLRKDDIMKKEDFDKTQDNRRKETQRLLDGFNLLKPDQQLSYTYKLKADIEVSQYERDFVSISKKTGLPVYNSFIDIANERAWEVAQVDYQDKINVTKSLEVLSKDISDYLDKLEKEVQNFLDTKFYSTGIFEKKMKMYCEFMDLHQGNKEISDMIYYKIKDPRYRNFYNFYGTKGCSAKKYQKENLELGMIDVSKESELSSVIYKKFKIGDRVVNKDIKPILQDIYRDLGITSKPKATDLGKYFKLTRTCITLPDKTIKEGYLLKSL